MEKRRVPDLPKSQPMPYSSEPMTMVRPNAAVAAAVTISAVKREIMDRIVQCTGLRARWPYKVLAGAGRAAPI